MYGLPLDLDLRFLEGGEVTNVSVGLYDVQLFIRDGVSLTFFDQCELDGIRFKAGPEIGVRLIRLLGKRIATARNVDGRHLQLQFDDDSVLIVRDDNKSYESYTITGPAGLIVV